MHGRTRAQREIRTNKRLDLFPPRPAELEPLQVDHKDLGLLQYGKKWAFSCEAGNTTGVRCAYQLPDIELLECFPVLLALAAVPVCVERSRKGVSFRLLGHKRRQALSGERDEGEESESASTYQVSVAESFSCCVKRLMQDSSGIDFC